MGYPLQLIKHLLLFAGQQENYPGVCSVPMSLEGMTPAKVAVVWGTFVTVGGVGMFLSPLLVGVLRDLSGQYLQGFLICSVAAWTLLAAGLLMPKDVF